MNYTNIYEKIIEKAKSENRKLKCGIYYEKHHIKPKSLFKDLTKDPNNIVLLTAKEHFICHMLLEKIYDCYQMKFAIWRMCNDGKYKVSMLLDNATVSFSFKPPTRNILPDNVISPVIDMFLGILTPLIKLRSEVTILIPAEGPSFFSVKLGKLR